MLEGRNTNANDKRFAIFYMLIFGKILKKT